MIRAWGVALFLLVACATALSANAHAATATSPSLKPADLMNARFNGWRPDKTWGWSLVVPDGIEWSGWLPVTGKRETLIETEWQSIEPLQVVRLDKTHAALVTVSSPVYENGHTQCGYTCSYFIGVVFFKADKGRWRETRHIDAAAWIVLYPGQTMVQKWEGHGHVFSAVTRGCWGGACTQDVVLLGLQPDRLLPLLYTSLNESNAGAEALGSDELTCGDLLAPGWRQPPQEHFDPTLDCREAKGTWRLSGDQVVFSFLGHLRRADSQGRAKPIKTWSREVTLGLRGDRLVPISGKLPEFGF